MKLFTAFACLLTGAAFSTALPAENSARSSAELATSKMVWTGQVKPGEDAVSFTGTAEEIYKQIVKINPSYDYELGLHSNSSTVQRRDLELLNKRATTSSDYTCAYGNNVNAESIGVGVRYLYSIANGDCASPAGPAGSRCVASTCNGGAGIWLCNDKTTDLHNACSIVADNAVEVLIQCQSTTYNGGSSWTSYTHGQIFSTDRSWNVILNTC
ncbi:hypothetical protein M426DRAFT_316474 [Hypoxylon sp. CI-4A]|nr:hypothetical protein M426DRAFT_316474 [Hypoxylon sp. CI-4A]